jgi:hypothetical protein
MLSLLLLLLLLLLMMMPDQQEPRQMQQVRRDQRLFRPRQQCPWWERCYC